MRATRLAVKLASEPSETVTVALASRTPQPSETVTVTVLIHSAVHDGSDVVLAGLDANTLEFTTGNWATPQTVTVTADQTMLTTLMTWWR